MVKCLGHSFKPEQTWCGNALEKMLPGMYQTVAEAAQAGVFADLDKTPGLLCEDCYNGFLEYVEMPVRGSRICMCNFPNDPWLDRGKDGDKYRYRRVAGQSEIELWHVDRPEQIWLAWQSMAQNAVLGGGTCMEFRLKT